MLRTSLPAVLAMLCLSGCGGGGLQPTVPAPPASALRAQEPQSSADHTVAVVPGWNSVGFEDRVLTAVSPGSSAVGVATWNGTSYDLGGLTTAELNAGEGTRRGTWVFSTGSGSFTYSGTNDSAAAPITLRAGWNLIAFPGITNVPGASLTVMRDGQTVSLGSVLLPQFTEIQPTNQYVTVDVSAGGSVRSGRAYWVFSSASCTLTAGGPSASPTPVASPPPPAASPLNGAGVTFTSQNAGTASAFAGVAYYNAASQHIVVGSNGTLLTSPNGSQWTRRNSGTTRSFLGVAADSSVCVAVGQQDTIRTSVDGVTWTARSTGESDSAHLYCAASNGNVLVIAGEEGRIFSSFDRGVTWTRRASAGATQILNGAAYGKNLFVVVGFRDPVTRMATLLTSPDGVTWTSRPTVNGSLLDVTFGNDQFVASGVLGDVFTSPDGITWTPRTSGSTQALLGVTYGAGLYLITCFDGTVLTSPDGVAWTLRTTPVARELLGAAYGGGRFVLAGAGSALLTSP